MRPRPQSLRTGHRRRWLVPIIILVFAGGLAVWSSREEARRQADIERFVQQLIELAGGSDDGLPPMLPVQLDRIKLELAAGPTAASVDVTAGDVDWIGDPTATHTAMISLDGRPRLGLRLQHRDGVVHVVGYWLPRDTTPNQPTRSPASDQAV